MKKIYLARHAEGEANVSLIRSSENSGLTARGREQAILLAQRCSNLNPEVIFSSNMGRARETALCIAGQLGKNILFSDLFDERRRPAEVNGRLKKDPEVIRIEKTIRDNFHKPNYRYSTEENFNDLKARALATLDFFESRTEQTILTVTHGIRLRVLMATAIFGSTLTGEQCEQFIRALRMEKSGIVCLSLNENLEEEGAAAKWQIWMWNDHAHLLSKF